MYDSLYAFFPFLNFKIRSMLDEMTHFPKLFKLRGSRNNHLIQSLVLSSKMSRSCNINMCKRRCCVLCHCCNKNLCFNHLKEHRDLIQIQLNPLVNEINLINDQLMTLNAEIFVRRIDYLRNVITQLRSTMSELICEQDSTNEDIILLTLTICWIKQEIERIIPIEHLDLSTLSSPFQTIICQYSLGSALASNNQQLLMDQRLNLQLFDQDFILKKQYQWKNDFIRDICWSSTLKKFIFITNNKQIYLVNDNLTSIEYLSMIPEQDWSSCTSSDISLFLTTNNQGTHIYEFNLSSIFELIQQWKSPHTCQQHEFIRDMVYNNQTLALIIEDSFSNMIRLELRSSTNLDLLWIFRSDIQYHLFQPAIRCCSLKYDEWLVIDSNNSRLFHINNNGQIKGLHVYKSPPWNAILHDSNTLVIRTENSLNFHKIY